MRACSRHPAEHVYLVSGATLEALQMDSIIGKMNKIYREYALYHSKDNSLSPSLMISLWWQFLLLNSSWVFAQYLPVGPRVYMLPQVSVSSQSPHGALHGTKADSTIPDKMRTVFLHDKRTLIRPTKRKYHFWIVYLKAGFHVKENPLHGSTKTRSKLL